VTGDGGRMFVGLSLKLVGPAMMIVPRVPLKVGLGRSRKPLFSGGL